VGGHDEIGLNGNGFGRVKPGYDEALVAAMTNYKRRGSAPPREAFFVPRKHHFSAAFS